MEREDDKGGIVGKKMERRMRGGRERQRSDIEGKNGDERVEGR